MLLKPSVLTSQCPMRSQAAHTARAALLVKTEGFNKHTALAALFSVLTSLRETIKGC